MFTNLTLSDLITAHCETDEPKIKRALLVLCNAVYKKKMGFVESEPIAQVDPMVPQHGEIFIGKHVGKIMMIKAHRERTGVGLVESKRACENYFYDHGLEFFTNNPQRNW